MLAIDLVDVGNDLFYQTPVADWSTWLDHVEAALLAHLDGGLVENAARTTTDDGRVRLDPDHGWSYATGVDYAVTTPQRAPTGSRRSRAMT